MATMVAMTPIGEVPMEFFAVAFLAKIVGERIGL